MYCFLNSSLFVVIFSDSFVIKRFVKENNSNGLFVNGVAVISNNLHDSAPDFL